MVYCHRCGSEIPEHGNFCPECGTLAEDTLFHEKDNNKVNLLELSDCAACVEKFNLSPAEFVTLIYRPKYLDNFFKSPYRVTLFYFILKGILELEIRSSRLILLNIDHVTVKKGPHFEKSLSTPFKPYESIMLDTFRSKDSFILDTYEKGPLSYKFESETFKNVFIEELLNRDYFKFEKRSIIGFGTKEYVLTDYGDSVRDTILSELYDLPDNLSELGTPSDYLYILSFFGLDETIIQEEKPKIEIFHRKLLAIEKAYEGRRGGHVI